MPEDEQPDFGEAGKVTIRVENVGVEVDLAVGQYLFYRLTVQGAPPLFAWTCEHKRRLAGKDFQGHPKKVYEWTWCRGSTSDKDANIDTYSVGMRFTAATKYTLLVELRDRDDEPIRTVKDLDFESQAPQDSFTSTLDILVV